MSRISSSLRRCRLQLEELETRQLLSGFQPTAVEQLFLQDLNAARANPTAYGQSIGVDLSYIAPSQPLAFDADLIMAARLHSQDMNARAYFSHYTPEGVDPHTRMIDAGYPGNTAWGESIAAGSAYPDPASVLAGLIIDAGVPDLGHRDQLLAVGSVDAMMQQVGIGIVQNGTGPYQNYYTIDTGGLPGTTASLTGVVYNDANGNGKFDLNEGLAGVTITVARVGSVVGFDAGGFSIPLNPGTYTVTASGGQLPSPITHVVTIGSSNVEVAFVSNTAAVTQMQTWVTLLYKNLLGRTAGQSEVNGWVANLQVGQPRDTVVTAILGSWEYNQRVVTQIYQQYLHRAPDAGGLAGFTNALMNGMSELAVRQIILSSDEYWALHGGNAAGYVQGLYNDVLGRSYSGQEAGYWISLAQSSNRAGVVAGLTGSWEANAVIVGTLYQSFLQRSPDQGGLTGWVNFLEGTGNWRYLIEQFGASIEFYNDSLVF
jgi:uncharacterized protein YkwD